MFTNPQFSFSTEPAWQTNFLGASSLPVGLSASGGTNGTYFNSSGVLTAGSSPRFDYNASTLGSLGLLVEESRTNLLTTSTNLSGWSTSGLTISTGATTSPDGTVDAGKLVASTAGSILAYKSATVSNSTAYTFSCCLKQSNARYGFIAFNDSVGDVGVSFDFQAGTVGSTFTASGGGTLLSAATIQNLGNGWWRVSISKTSTSTSLVPFVGPCDNASTTSGRPNYSAGSGNGIYVFGAQLEAGTFATSYIPTTSTSVQRTADVLTFSGVPLTALQGASGSVIIQLLDENSTNPAAIKNIIAGTNSILYHDTTGKVGTTNGTNILLTGSAATWSSATRVGLAWGPSARAIAATGISNATDANSASNGGTIYLGSSNGSSAENAWFQGISIYKQNIANLLQSKMTVNGRY